MTNKSELGPCPMSFARSGSDYVCNPKCEWFDNRKKKCVVYSIKTAIEKLITILGKGR